MGWLVCARHTFSAPHPAGTPRETNSCSRRHSMGETLLGQAETPTMMAVNLIQGLEIKHKTFPCPSLTKTSTLSTISCRVGSEADLTSLVAFHGQIRSEKM